MAKKDEKVIALLKELIIRIAGKGAEQIVDIMFGKKNVNEFKIAEKFKITINQARNILYKLLEAGIMDSTRKKDKKKGWYTYFWTIDTFKALKAYEKLKEQEIEIFRNLLKNREIKTFYFCQSDSLEMNEETALNHDFMCPECGQLLQPVPREKKMKEISLRIDSVNRKLNIIREEIEKHKPKARPPEKPKARAKAKAKPKAKPELKKKAKIKAKPRKAKEKKGKAKAKPKVKKKQAKKKRR